MKMSPGTIAWILFAIAIFMPQNTLQYTTTTWDLDFESETYSTFITSLRTAISAATVCNIQVTPKTPAANAAFVYVDIINTNSKTITLAFRKTNVYFVGFKDKLNGAWRANFVKDDFAELQDSDVFSDAKIRSELPHGGGYDNLVKVGNLKSRGDLSLGVTSLSSFIDTIYGADYNGKNKPKDIGQSLARFALMSVQMIAEASRFKYIEGKVETGGMFGSFKPDDVFLKLENNWDTISQLIHAASPGCKAVKAPGFTWADIKPQMGLLKYKSTTLNVVGDDVALSDDQ